MVHNVFTLFVFLVLVTCHNHLQFCYGDFIVVSKFKNKLYCLFFFAEIFHFTWLVQMCSFMLLAFFLY